MSNEEVQVNHAKKMLTWVEEHDNRIPSVNAKDDQEEKACGKWWNSAKSTQVNYVGKYADALKAVLFGETAAQKKIEADYNKTIAGRTTMSNEEVQVNHAKKMLTWVEEHDNRIPSQSAKGDQEEKTLGIWWNSAKSTQVNYVGKYADALKTVLFGETAAQKKIEADYNKTIAGRTTMSNEEVQVNRAKKMLTWVEEHDNRIPSVNAKEDQEEKTLGIWWSSAKSPQVNYVGKYADALKAVLFGETAAQKAIEADYNKTIRKREAKQHSDDDEKTTVDLPLLKKRRTKKTLSSTSKKRKRDTEAKKRRNTPQALPNAYGVRHNTDHKQWKTSCNTVFGAALEQNNGKILVLDDDTSPSFGTSSCLVEHHGIRPEQLCIVQYDEDKAETMLQHSVFGPRVVHGSVQSHLKMHGGEYTGIYLDLCGSWETQLRPSLEALFRAGFQDGLVLGVTWGTRNPFGQTEDYSAMMLQSLFMLHACVERLDESQYEGMRTSFYILYHKKH